MPADIVEDSAALPTDYAGVRIFKCRDTAILIDLEERLALDALLWVVAELPALDFIRKLEELECDCNLDWVWSSSVCVEDEGFRSDMMVVARDAFLMEMIN